MTDDLAKLDDFSRAYEAYDRAQKLHDAYHAAPSAERVPQLIEAIRLYETILEAIAGAERQSGQITFTIAEGTFDWFSMLQVLTGPLRPTAQRNLGVAYSELPTGDRERADHLDPKAMAL